MLRALLALALVAVLAGQGAGQTREEKVLNDKKKVEAKGYWLYNDLPKAFAEGKKTGKPIIVVLRCLPCVECVKLDDELIDADKRLKPLLEKFVRVRVVSTNGLDLSLFQFDTDQSFAVFLLNADGTIYGRFGTRSHRTEWIGDVSIEGLAKALEGALALHKEYPKNKAALAAKRGPAPAFASPEKYPTLKGRYKATLDYKGKVVPSCIHCHQVGEAIRDVVLKKKERLSANVLFPYPHPRVVGLVLDPKEKATVSEVLSGSAAAKAGLKAGDAIQKLNGQPLLSIADVQWVLHRASGDGAALKAEVLRAGKTVNLTLKLEKGWRERDNISWRVSTWALRRVALGGMLVTELPEDERKKAKVPDGAMALLVKYVAPNPPYNTAQRSGVRKDDIFLSIDGKSDFRRETDLINYLLRGRKRGGKVSLVLLRGGKKMTLELMLPE
jgi:hypothetical protein